MLKKISPISLVLLIVAAIDSIRNLPAAALFGPSLIFFFIFSAVIFLIPIALVSGELSATFHEKGGVYHWVKAACGEKWGMVAIWLQWVNTMIWAPTILSFIAGTAAYLVNPSFAQDEIYLVCFILFISWTLTGLNVFGVRISAKVNSICAVIGTIFPLTLLILFGLFWVFGGHPLQVHVDAASVLPSLDKSANWVSLIAIMSSFLGMELSGVHVEDVREPQRNFPKALLFASAFILLTMLFGSLSIAFVVPEKEINLIAGVMQVFSTFFHAFGLDRYVPVLTLLIVVGTIGSLTNWFISPAKGLLQAAEHGFIPRFLAQKNRYHVAHRILIGQAIVISLLCAVFLFVPSINGFYWFLTALSTSMYMLMYILIFISALRLRLRNKTAKTSFRVPGGMAGLWTAVVLGLFACVVTVVVSFVPPTNIDVGKPLYYCLTIALGSIFSVLPVLLTFWYKNSRKA